MPFSPDFFANEAKIVIRGAEHAREVLERLYALGCGFDSDFNHDHSHVDLGNVMGIAVSRVGNIGYWFRGVDDTFFNESGKPLVTLKELNMAEPPQVLAQLERARQALKRREYLRTLAYKIGRLTPEHLSDEQVALLEKVVELHEQQNARKTA